MTPRFEIRYKCLCTNCNKVVKSADRSTFLSPFFMPDHCPHCGEYRSDGDRFGSGSGWRLQKDKWHVTRLPFKLFKPSTWDEKWAKVSSEEA